MKMYNKNAFCIKCGETDITSAYHEKSDGCSVVLSTDVCGGVKQEHIVRHCTNCHCEWLEKPLNLEEAKP